MIRASIHAAAAMAMLATVAAPAAAEVKMAVMDVSVTVADGCAASTDTGRTAQAQVTLACPDGIAWTASAAKDGRTIATWSDGGIGTGMAQTVAALPAETLVTSDTDNAGDLVITISY